VLSDTTERMLSDGLLNRDVKPEMPPHVEYALTERGRSLIPVIEVLAQWGSGAPVESRDRVSSELPDENRPA
ncbi:MAG: winged helix-turn-helix transcriptional regulator, partial [Pseudomonadota bacterium]